MARRVRSRKVTKKDREIDRKNLKKARKARRKHK